MTSSSCWTVLTLVSIEARQSDVFLLVGRARPRCMNPRKARNEYIIFAIDSVVNLNVTISEVRNKWSFTSLSLHISIAQCRIQQKEGTSTEYPSAVPYHATRKLATKRKSEGHFRITLADGTTVQGPYFETMGVKKWRARKEKGRAGYEASTCFVALDLSGKNQSQIQDVQLKSGPLTKPWIFHVRCYL